MKTSGVQQPEPRDAGGDGHRPDDAAEHQAAPARRACDRGHRDRRGARLSDGPVRRSGDPFERGLQLDGGAEAIGRVRRDRTFEHRAQHGRQRGVAEQRPRRVATAERQGRRPRAEPGRRRQLVKHRAEAVEIAALVERPSEVLLGRHVVRRAGTIGDQGRRGANLGGAADARERTGQSEVHDLHRPVGGDEDVAGLEVAVEDALGVRVADRRRDLDAEPAHLLERQRAVAEPVQQRLPLDVLHDETGPVLVVDDVVDLRDVRVIEQRDGAGLALQEDAIPGAFDQRVAEHLDGDVAIQARIAREEHFRHAASAQLPDDLVAADLCAEGEVDRRHDVGVEDRRMTKNGDRGSVISDRGTGAGTRDGNRDWTGTRGFGSPSPDHRSRLNGLREVRTCRRRRACRSPPPAGTGGRRACR